jgi:hypothetical protein
MCLERSTLNSNAENRQREGAAWTTPLPGAIDGYAYAIRNRPSKGSPYL